MFPVFCNASCLLRKPLTQAIGPNNYNGLVGGDKVRKPLFEEYWHSGAPLSGEEGASGWQAWAVSRQSSKQLMPPPQEDPGPPLDCSYIRGIREV
jgi:hypothetical protein